MARGTSANYSANPFTYATAGTDIFKKEDVQVLAQAVETHDHTTGKGLSIPAGAIPNGTITSAMIADGTIQGADIATGTITTTQIADGTIATADLANSAVTNAKLGTDTARLNLVTNGGFEIWQRGNGPFTATGVYGPDRWQLGITGTDTLSVQKTTAVTDVGSNAAAVATVTFGSGGGNTNLSQQFRGTADGYGLKGRTVTVSVRVNTTTANAVQIALGSDGTGASIVRSAFVAPGGFQTISVSYTVPSDATYAQTWIYFSASCTAYVDNAMLVVGSVAADYAPLHPADDLARCLRYYETTYPLNGVNIATGQAVSATQAYAPVLTKVRKAVTSTITFAGSWAITQANGTQVASTPSSSAVTPDGLSLGLTGSGLVAGNAILCFGTSASSAIVFEANP